jgi:hypothetical protein
MSYRLSRHGVRMRIAVAACLNVNVTSHGKNYLMSQCA